MPACAGNRPKADSALPSFQCVIFSTFIRTVHGPCDIAFFAHAETNQGPEALIGAAPAFPGPGFLLPTRNHEVFEWCLDRGLRLVMQTTLITDGLYNEPAGAYLPSILY